MHSLYTNEVTDYLKSVGISIASIHQLLQKKAKKKVLSYKLDISLRPSKSTGQTQFDVMRDVIVQTFLLVIRPVSQVLQVGTKIS